MKYLTRIVTFMASPRIVSNDPREILREGSRVLTMGDKTRVFTVRKVAYDGSMTPLYSQSTTSYYENRYDSVTDLIESHPGMKGKPILDLDKKLKPYNYE